MTLSIPEELHSFLDAPRFGVLATIDPDGAPQQSVVWYQRRGDRILINTRRGRRKDRNVRRDRRVSFLIEDEYRWLCLSGTVEIVDDRDSTQSDMLTITRRYKPPEEAQREYDELYSRQERVSLWLTVERIVAYGFDE